MHAAALVPYGKIPSVLESALEWRESSLNYLSQIFFLVGRTQRFLLSELFFVFFFLNTFPWLPSL